MSSEEVTEKMNIIMTSIDHERAGLEERENFSCSSSQTKAIYDRLREDQGIEGAVLINTCNRTELYLSLAEEVEADPFRILCEELDVDEKVCRHLQNTLRGEDVLRHLCLLTAGAKSQLWGDSQIITQVGDAVEEAREEGLTDGVLNTVFRLGITAGKDIRTHVDLHIHDASTAQSAVDLIQEYTDINTVLVIGNGTIGRMIAKRLAAAGMKTFMTLRRYHHGETFIPEGVEAVPYDERYRIMEECDAVVSATASPHVVVSLEGIKQIRNRPRLFVDMAVPRDIDARVGSLDGLECYNIDDISQGHHVNLKKEQRRKLEDYLEDQVDEFNRWEASREKVENKISRLTDPDRDRKDRRYFPLFIDTMDRPVVVIGGGNIAERRVMTLAEFGFDISIVSETLTETLRRMVDGDAARWICGRYREDLLEGAWLVLACTNDRDINRDIGRYCRENGYLVNVCDARNESTFWFPAVALSDELTVGLVGRGTDHRNVKKAAARLRRVVEKKEYK